MPEIRQPAEIKYQAELAALLAADTGFARQAATKSSSSSPSWVARKWSRAAATASGISTLARSAERRESASGPRRSCPVLADGW